MDSHLKKVVFICGAGHSGSTLLGLILGSHSDCFYSGEAKNSGFMGDENKPIKKRTCKVCGADCPVWSKLPIDDSKTLYEQLSTQTQKPIIIDSTKDVAWIVKQLDKIKDREYQPFLIFIQRDGRAVINSWVRKEPNADVKKQIKKWIDNIRSADELFNNFPAGKMKIRYENLAIDPAREIEQICNLLEIEYESEMLNFYECQHHPLGGNNGTQFLLLKAQERKANDLLAKSDRTEKNLVNSPKMKYYENHELGISLDLRWREELDPRIEKLFEEMAGKENAEMKWDA